MSFTYYAEFTQDEAGTLIPALKVALNSYEYDGDIQSAAKVQTIIEQLEGK
jgi:hypothetical protein